MKFVLLLMLVCLFVSVVFGVCVQDGEVCNWVVIVENVKFDYVQVFNVEFVFQMLWVICMEEYCELVFIWILVLVNVIGEELQEEKGCFGCFMDLVCLIFCCEDGSEEEMFVVEVLLVNNGLLLICDCWIILVGWEFCWFIVYDVDYVYKGIKYCFCFFDDFGNCLKICVFIILWVVVEQGGLVNL